MNDIDRIDLQAEFIDRVLENMDMHTLLMIAQEHLESQFDQMGDEQFIAEVSTHYPDLLEGVE